MAALCGCMWCSHIAWLCGRRSSAVNLQARSATTPNWQLLALMCMVWINQATLLMLRLTRVKDRAPNILLSCSARANNVGNLDATGPAVDDPPAFCPWSSDGISS